MKIVGDVSLFLNKVTGFNQEYIYLFLLSLIALVVLKVIKAINCKIYLKINKNSRDRFLYNKKMSLIMTVIFCFLLLMIWESHIKSFMTLISFVSASLTIALRDIIFNFFSGIYIQFTKPFEIEDRIEINSIKGDVININPLSFELLEVGENLYGEQSTGRIVHLPNNLIFSSNLKNYSKAFKYVWHEIMVKIPLDADVRKTKGVLYRIVNKNEVIKSIPSKMAHQINDASMDYRIYYNKLKPIVYTKVVDDHIELHIRYLIHPKKSRNVEDDIWTEILKAYRNEEIVLKS